MLPRSAHTVLFFLLTLISVWAATYGAARAAVVTNTLDFEGLSRGAVVTNQFAPLVTVSALPGRNGVGSAMVFDSENWSGGDRDLKGPFRTPGVRGRRAFGNILIISEDNDALDPDDNASGGAFVFDFARPVFFRDLTAIDINACEGLRIDLYDPTGTLLRTVTNGRTVGDREYLVVSAGVANVARSVVSLSGSGAIDELRFDAAPVPVPGALPLMITGFGGIWTMKKRRAKKK